MNKKRWGEAYSSLRKVLRKIPALDAVDTFCDGKFGVGHDTNFGWLVWNGTARHVIAAVKFDPNRIVMRYRQNSRYSQVLSAFNYEDERPTIHVRSSSMRQHRQSARSLVGDEVAANINRRRTLGFRNGARPGMNAYGFALPMAYNWRTAEQEFNRVFGRFRFRRQEVLLMLARRYSRWIRNNHGNDQVFMIQVQGGEVEEVREGVPNPTWASFGSRGGVTLGTPPRTDRLQEELAERFRQRMTPEYLPQADVAEAYTTADMNMNIASSLTRDTSPWAVDETEDLPF